MPNQEEKQAKTEAKKAAKTKAEEAAKVLEAPVLEAPSAEGLQTKAAQEAEEAEKAAQEAEKAEEAAREAKKAAEKAEEAEKAQRAADFEAKRLASLEAKKVADRAKESADFTRKRWQTKALRQDAAIDALGIKKAEELRKAVGKVRRGLLDAQFAEEAEEDTIPDASPIPLAMRTAQRKGVGVLVETGLLGYTEAIPQVKVETSASATACDLMAEAFGW